MDKIWHEMILETADYADLCGRLRPGSFVHHSGITYSDYALIHDQVSRTEEHFSWLVSYINAFGEIEPEALVHLPMARKLMSEANTDLAGINKIGLELLTRSSPSQEPNSLSRYLRDIEKEGYSQIDSDPNQMAVAIHNILKLISADNEIRIPTNQELESVFASSTALGFTLWQHCAAVERLFRASDWQHNNQETWKQIRTGQKLVGLATTHLAREDVTFLKTDRVESGCILNGSIPWTSGFGIFDFLVLGAREGEEFFYFLSEYTSQMQYTPHQMVRFMGSCTGRLECKNLQIESNSFIEHYSASTSKKSSSRYVFPELGVAKRAIEHTLKTIRAGSNPRFECLESEVNLFKKKLESIEEKRTIEADIQLAVEVDQLIRDSVRLLTIAEGGHALSKGSISNVLSIESILFDVVIHSPQKMKMKASQLLHA